MKLNPQDFGIVALALMALGVGFMVFDFFICELVKKLFPDPEYWTRESTTGKLSPTERVDFERRKRLYASVISHRFRFYGMLLALVGGVLFGIAKLS